MAARRLRAVASAVRRSVMRNFPSTRSTRGAGLQSCGVRRAAGGKVRTGQGVWHPDCSRSRQ
jgi:hypothetical protein